MVVVLAFQEQTSDLLGLGLPHRLSLFVHRHRVWRKLRAIFILRPDDIIEVRVVTSRSGCAFDMLCGQLGLCRSIYSPYPCLVASEGEH
jgi:hypothetical protein